MNNDELTKKINLDCALNVNNEPIRKLKSILKLCDKSYLEELYFNITDFESDDKKKVLIDALYSKLSNKAVIQKFLDSLIKDEYDVLIKIIENNGCIQDDYIEFNFYHYLKAFGIVYTFNYQDKFYLVIPDEIMNELKDIDICSYSTNIDNNTNLFKLAYSMVNLYGAVPLNLLRDYYIKHYSVFNPNLNCLLSNAKPRKMKTIETEKNIYFVKDDDLGDLNEITLTNKTLLMLDDNIYDFDYKDIEIDNLLKYYNMFYYEDTDSVISFKKFLKGYNLNEGEIDSLVSGLINSFRRDYSEGMHLLNNIFLEFNIEVNNSNINEILLHLNNVVNDISSWGNKGWTNKEIALMNIIDV